MSTQHDALRRQQYAQQIQRALEDQQEQAAQYERVIEQLQRQLNNSGLSPRGFSAQSEPVPVQVEKARQEINQAELDYQRDPAFEHALVPVTPGADVDM